MQNHVESLEPRQFLCAGSAAASLPAAMAAPGITAQRVAPNPILGTYKGKISITTPYPASTNAVLRITGFKAATKVVTGTISLPAYFSTPIPFSVQSTYNPTTRAFVIRFSKGAGNLKVSATIKGTRNATTSALDGRFTGVVPYQGFSVNVDGTFHFAKS
jgi:hypothetical protein